ncbi:MAG: segregation/condensation protein A [Candidatus Caenarcaniphilales bacterium]|nr:segregation/condensation protein A [Candidatus Caenarcaniphilales bacterium]
MQNLNPKPTSKIIEEYSPIPQIQLGTEIGNVSITLSETQLEAPQEKNWLDSGPEMLVEMAKSGEIDPWDVDLVFVIDKFLSQLQGKEDKQELQEAARIIFFVSVLLRIKSQFIYVKPIQPQDELTDEYGDLIDFDAVDFEEIDPNAQFNEILNPKALDRVLSRNPRGMKEPRRRKITLDDLIDLFKEVESKTSKKKIKKKVSLEDFEEDGIVLREDEETDIYDLAHDENLEQKIEMLSVYILQKLELEKETTLSDLKDLVGDQIDTFLSALFLTHSGKTEIRQKAFYEEIWLMRLV